ncbi:hypothetical protein DVH05_017329 [Phytophthora capsici]|nr:hypothetical protein DVH05_017329 [Phytophthora capsici]
MDDLHDLPIIELPEHYRVDGERLGRALAHVSAQANSIAEHQAELQHRQSRHEEEQQRFVEQRVAAAREEADARCNALVLAIQQTYGDPMALEHRVDARIQDVLQQLQHGAQQQARVFAEAQIADQVALSQLVEQRMHAAVLDMQQEINLRVDKLLQDLRRDITEYVKDQLNLAVLRADDNTRTLMNNELEDQRNLQQASIARSETRIAELVRGIINQHDSAMRVRQQQESDVRNDHIEERLRQVVTVAKTAAESKAREVMAQRSDAPGPASTSAATAKSKQVPPVDKVGRSITTAKPKPKPLRRSERKDRSKADQKRSDERNARANVDRIRHEAQEAVRTRAATRAAELLTPTQTIKSKRRLRS